MVPLASLPAHALRHRLPWLSCKNAWLIWPKRSVTLNQLEDQVTVVNDDLKNLLDHAPRSQVDLILCNPPYFKATETSKKNLSEHYLLARHEITTNLEEICQVARHACKI